MLCCTYCFMKGALIACGIGERFMGEANLFIEVKRELQVALFGSNLFKSSLGFDPSEPSSFKSVGGTYHDLQVFLLLPVSAELLRKLVEFSQSFFAVASFEHIRNLGHEKGRCLGVITLVKISRLTQLGRRRNRLCCRHLTRALRDLNNRFPSRGYRLLWERHSR